MTSASPEQYGNAVERETIPSTKSPHHDSSKHDQATTETVIDALNNPTVQRQPSHSPRPSTSSSSMSTTSQAPPEKKKKVHLNESLKLNLSRFKDILTSSFIDSSLVLHILPAPLLRQPNMDRYPPSYHRHSISLRRRCAIPSDGYHLWSARQRPQHRIMRRWGCGVPILASRTPSQHQQKGRHDHMDRRD